VNDDELVAAQRPMTDGVITLRPPTDEDRVTFIAGRDDESRRWLGPGADDPCPTAAVVAHGQVVGWVDYDTDREWLEPGEVNVGYNVFPAHRGQCFASRALELLIQHLSEATHFDTVTLLIDPENLASLAVAASTNFQSCGEITGSRYFKRPIPGL
jgi:RimJ/RimL family protein N-acetyltransferase